MSQNDSIATLVRSLCTMACTVATLLTSTILWGPGCGFSGAQPNASSDSKSARELEVRQVEIYPPELTVLAGQPAALVAIPRRADGAPVVGCKIRWRAEDIRTGSRVPIPDNGQLSAATTGTFRVTAESNGVESISIVQVVDHPTRQDDGVTDVFEPIWQTMSPGAATSVTNSRGRQPLNGHTSLLSHGEQGAGQGNFRLDVPILNLTGRGLDLSISLVYNSRVWSKDTANHIVYDADGDFPAPGWSLGFGRLVRLGAEAVMIVDGDGTRHAFSGVRTGSIFTGYTTDGTYLDYSVHFSDNEMVSGTVQYRNGAKVVYSSTGTAAVYPTSIVDANGNTISIAYSQDGPPRIRYLYDTLGRVITFYYDDADNFRLLTAITAPGLHGDERTIARFQYQHFDLEYLFDGALVASTRRSGPQWLMRAIYFPGTSTGYWFGDPDSYSSYGMIAKVISQRGMSFTGGRYFEAMGTVAPGSVTRQRTYNYPLGVAPGLVDAPTYTQTAETWADMDTGPAVTSYAVHFNDTPRSVETTFPDGRREIRRSYNHPGEWDDGLLYEQELKGSDNRQLGLQQITWQSTGVADHEAPRVTTQQATDEQGQVTKKVIEYAKFDAPSTIYEYDALQLLRRTVYSYVSDANYELVNHIFHLVGSILVYDGAGTLVSATGMQYDEASLAATPEITGWSPPPGQYRGNLTSTSWFSDALHTTGEITQLQRYDSAGNLITISGTCCVSTTFTFTEDTQYAFPTSVTNGDPATPSDRVATQAAYDLGTALQLTATDAGGNITRFAYEPSTLRLTEATFATDASLSYSYSDATSTVVETRRAADGTIADQVIRRLNGIELPHRTEVLGDGGHWDQTDVQYDQSGRPWRRSRPHRDGESLQWSEVSYDKAGRPFQVQAADGSTSHMYYNEPDRPSSASSASGQTVRSQDAWGNERWFRIDALGRLAEVVEPDPTHLSVFGLGNVSTSYSYDVLGSLLAVQQGAQQRRFRYDSLGRLTHQKLAERTATLDDDGNYIGTGTWSDRFRYDERSNLVSHMDARGVNTFFDYDGDPLNRLQRTRYDTSTFGDVANPIEAAPSVSYEYVAGGDTTRPSTITVAGVATEQYGYDPVGRPSSKIVTFHGRAGYPLAIDTTYDSLGRVADLRFPTQYGFAGETRRLIHHEYGTGGRLSRLTADGVDHASQFVYNSAGQATSMNIGPPGPAQVTEQYSFDPLDGLLVGQKVLQAGTLLMDLSYRYVTPGTTVGCTGRVTALVDNMDRDRDRNYSYDSLGRLAGVSGGRYDAPFWATTYNYDRYGNRTAVRASGFIRPTSGRAPPVSGAASGSERPGHFIRLGAVSAFGNGAQFISQSVPEFMLQGSHNEVTFAMKNTGDTDWDPSTHQLGSRNPQDNTVWGSNRATTGDWVYPGEQASFRQVVTAPSQPGFYNFQWQMVETGLEWFGEPTPSLAIQVVPPGPFPPTELSLQAMSATEIDMIWKSNSTDEDGFVIERRTGIAGSYAEIGRVGRRMTAYFDRGLTPGTTYYYRVRAYNARGQSPFSNEAAIASWTAVPTDGVPSMSYEGASNRIASAGYAYDAAGNQVRALRDDWTWQGYVYDAAGRMVRVTDESGIMLESYTYGKARERLVTQRRATPALHTYYVWNGASVVSEYTELDGAPNFPAWGKSYVQIGLRLLATLTPNDDRDSIQYHHPDRLGSRLMTSGSTTDYFEQVTLPFGTPLPAESTGSSNPLFTSYDRSSVTGLDYAINRHYDSSLGRFVQVDPMELGAVDPKVPQSMNLYTYAGGDPVNQLDPLGTDPILRDCTFAQTPNGELISANCNDIVTYYIQESIAGGKSYGGGGDGSGLIDRDRAGDNGNGARRGPGSGGNSPEVYKKVHHEPARFSYQDELAEGIQDILPGRGQIDGIKFALRPLQSESLPLPAKIAYAIVSPIPVFLFGSATEVFHIMQGIYHLSGVKVVFAMLSAQP